MAVILCKTCGEPLFQYGGESSTLVGYHSPPGHNHDDNCIKRSYQCSNGHSIVVSKRRSCKVCDWKGKEDCLCHDGAKVDEWPS